VIDVAAGKWVCSISGFKKTQGALFVPELNKLFLASGDDGMVRVFRGDTFELLDSIASKVQVIDRKKREVLSTWPVTSQRDGDAAFDESTSRLFIGTRTPPEMVVMDSKSGREIAHLPTAENVDGVYSDATRKRIYVSGGRDLATGSVYVYRQKDADHYDTIGIIPTREGAGTSFWSPDLSRYYVAASKNDNEEAAIFVYEPEN
jgi:hypothetical protein